MPLTNCFSRGCDSSCDNEMALPLNFPIIRSKLEKFIPSNSEMLTSPNPAIIPVIPRSSSGLTDVLCCRSITESGRNIWVERNHVLFCQSSIILLSVRWSVKGSIMFIKLNCTYLLYYVMASKHNVCHGQ